VTESTPMRVLLVDDHALFRAGLASLLSAWGLEVVGQAGDGREAIEKARELRPDLIFMDISMPELNGFEATRAIKTEFAETKIIILTVSDDDSSLFEAIKSGAEGYLLKNLREEEFSDLVRRVSLGEPAMSPGLAAKLLDEFARLKGRELQTEVEESLTPREQEVLEKLAHGASNRQIAEALYISENTVSYHMKNILSKLHLRNRTQVAAWALEHGYTAQAPE